MNLEGKRRMQGKQELNLNFSEFDNLPFLAIETDGSPFPQLIEANLESFVLQAKRIHKVILNNRKKHLNALHKNLSIRLYDLVTGNGKNLKIKARKISS